MGRLCARRGVCGGRAHHRRRVKKNKSAGPSGPADFLFEGKTAKEPSQASLCDANSPEGGAFWREPMACHFAAAFFEAGRFGMASALLWPYSAENRFLIWGSEKPAGFSEPFFTGRRAEERQFESYYIKISNCSAAHKESHSLLKKSETLWKCRETKIGRLFIGAKCDTLQI